MKMKRKIIIGLLSMCLVFLSGCSHSNSAQAANVMRFEVSTISDITLSYDEEAITFFRSESDELIVKEYMSKNKSSYYAEIKQDDSSIQISEGRKPFFKSNFIRYIEVYLPEKYSGNLTVTTTDGDIDMSDMTLALNSLRIDSTAGTIQLSEASASVIYLSSTSGKLNLGNIKGEQIKLNTTSGTLKCAELEGDVTYTSTSGDLDVESCVGSGKYRADNSGKLKVVYTEVTGDLSLLNKNDDIQLTLPKDLEFDFEATTKNGSVATSFQENISVDGRTSRGTVGSRPTVTVAVETKNGSIQVTQ